MTPTWFDDGHEIALAMEDDWSLRAKFTCPLKPGESGPCRLKKENPEPWSEDNDDEWEQWVDDPNGPCALSYANNEDAQGLIACPSKPFALVHPGPILWSYEGFDEEWSISIKNPSSVRDWKIITPTEKIDFRGTSTEVEKKIEELELEGRAWAMEVW